MLLLTTPYASTLYKTQSDANQCAPNALLHEADVHVESPHGGSAGADANQCAPNYEPDKLSFINAIR